MTQEQLIAEWQNINYLAEVGDVVEVIDNNSCHGFEIGSKVTCTKRTDQKMLYPMCFFGNWSMSFKDYKIIPTQKQLDSFVDAL